MFLGSSLAICSSRHLWNVSPFWTSLRQCNISLFAWRFHESHARCNPTDLLFTARKGAPSQSPPRLGGKTSPRDGSWDISYDQGGKMAARNVLKEVLRPGNGPCPSKGSTITVHCTGSLNTNPPKKFWRYWFCYECIRIARLIYRILFIPCMHVIHVKVFFSFSRLVTHTKQCSH